MKLLFILLFPLMAFAQGTVQINGSGPAPPATFTISGVISGPAASGTTLTLSPGGQTIQSDSGGHYSFANITTGSYTVTPSSTGYTFSPTVSGALTVGNPTANFSSAATTYSITGTITQQTAGVTNPASPDGISVNINNGGTCTQTANGGQYTCSNLLPNTYTITPVQPASGVVIIPTSLTGVQVSNQNVTNPGTFTVWPGYGYNGTMTTGGANQWAPPALYGLYVSGPVQVISAANGTATNITFPSRIPNGHWYAYMTVGGGYLCYPASADWTSFEQEFDINNANATGVNWTCETGHPAMWVISVNFSGLPVGLRPVITITGPRSGTLVANNNTGWAMNIALFVDGTYSVTATVPGYKLEVMPGNNPTCTAQVTGANASCGFTAFPQ